MNTTNAARLENSRHETHTNESIHDIATDLETISNVLSDLLSLASEELAQESRRGLTLVAVAERYAADVKAINQRLYVRWSQQHKA
ncbi:MAG: hypothetical protein JWR22_1298 [Herminiimonas sp.]|nr:hypothetical protein [Herminiimonas sp.]